MENAGAGERIPASLVLGSGGARGLAHIGVIRALQEHGRFDICAITGSSIGALIGGLHAAGRLDTYTEWVRGLSGSDVWGLLDFSFTSAGLFKGDRLMKKLAELVGEARIEDLPIPFTAIASDINRRREVWIDRGSLFEAIRASIAIPGFFTPVHRDGRVLVDGGLMSPLPIAPAQDQRAQRLIVVSLNGNGAHAQRMPAEDDQEQAPAPQPEAPGSLLQGWYRDAWAKLGLGAGKDDHYTAVEIFSKSLEAMQDRIERYQIAAFQPDIMVEISADACGVLDFHRAEEMIELGYRKALREIERAG